MNPLLAIQIADHVREEIREHPKKWGCLGLLLLIGPGLSCVLVVGLLILVIARGTGGSAAVPGQVPGIPDVMLTAYHQAAQRVTTIRPACHGMRWSILAGIAEVESRHASDRTIAPNGDVAPPILGPALDGSGVGGNRTPIRNPDGTFARAEGPFQFLTTTWATIAQDGNNDGARNPHNAFDAALGAAVYLCGTDPRDLNNPAQLRAALFSYNASTTYVDHVLANIKNYDTIQPVQGGQLRTDWPPERATMPDPTSRGQITPRTLKLVETLRANGMTGAGIGCFAQRPANPASDHPQGRACDVMFNPHNQTSVADGWRVANWLIAHQPDLGIHYLIWQGQYWAADEPNWATYHSDAYGCPNTANLTGCHYDHVHISVF